MHDNPTHYLKHSSERASTQAVLINLAPLYDPVCGTKYTILPRDADVCGYSLLGGPAWMVGGTVFEMWLGNL